VIRGLNKLFLCLCTDVDKPYRLFDVTKKGKRLLLQKTSERLKSSKDKSQLHVTFSCNDHLRQENVLRYTNVDSSCVTEHHIRC
jgi:hypothetical protein